MLQTIINAWKVADIRKKLLYTALILFLFRIGAALPVPFVNITGSGIVGDVTGAATFMNYLVMMTGDAFNYGTVFAMSITPYINASIIIQLLTVAIPYLEKLQKEGEEGRKKISAITRYMAVSLGLLQSTAYYVYLRQSPNGYLAPAPDGNPYTGFWAFFQAAAIVLTFTAGTALIMWLGEQVNEKGIGNGISLILFAGIISRIPTMFIGFYRDIDKGGLYFLFVPLTVIMFFIMIIFIIWMDSAQLRLPVQYAKRVVGRKMYGGQSTHIPMKVNMSGVLPVIFAGSILSLPPTIEMFLQNRLTDESWWHKFFNIFNQEKSVAYAAIYFIFIIFFAYFYSAIQYNPVEMANNIRKNSGAIPGIRPGKPTSDYITKVMSKITLLGALLLSVVALQPVLFSIIFHAFGKPVSGMSLGGTSIIIMVGVALETVRQLESQMMMRHYKGFLD
ncbi:MAG: preprotein translocase subunit SecY [Oscillospiraceae bacterium]|nr:preprotein translocase subunit SecY [Oscillospiraceae bacterium]